MFSSQGPTSNSDPGFTGTAITPHATNAIRSDGSFASTAPAPCRGIYVGVGGDIVVRLKNASADLTFVGVPQGSILPVAATHVRATGTTATSLIALW